MRRVFEKVSYIPGVRSIFDFWYRKAQAGSLFESYKASMRAIYSTWAVQSADESEVWNCLEQKQLTTH